MAPARREVLKSALTTAGEVLLRHSPSAALLGLSAAIGVAAAIPAFGMGDLRFAGVRDGGWPLAWSGLERSAAATQQLAVTTLATVVRGTALAALAVAILTILVLSVARARARRADVQLRRAVGASRRVLTGASLMEGGAIAGLGLVGGLVAATCVTRSLAAAWPGTVGAAGAASWPALVLLVTAGVVVAGCLLPLMYARRRSAPPASGGEELWLPVPIVQFGFGLTVLVLAGQLARVPRSSDDARSGEGAVIEVTPPDTALAVRSATYAALLERSGPASALVSLTSPGALVGLGTVDIAITDCGQCAQGGIIVQHRAISVVHHLVSADTFGAIGIPVVTGRGMGATDTWEAPRVAVVSRRLAQGHFQGGDALGRLIQIGRGSDRWYTVVGVAGDHGPSGFGGASQPLFAVYLSVLQHPPRTADLLVGGAFGPAAAAATAAAAGTGVAATAPVPVHRVRAAETQPTRWFGHVVRFMGWAAVAAAIVGMFGVMRLWATGFVPELAVRRAVGARRTQAVGFVAVRALGVAAAGAGVAWWLGPLVSDAAARVIPGLPPWELRMAAAPWAVLAVATVVGAGLPAWRVATAQPAPFVGQGGP